MTAFATTPHQVPANGWDVDRQRMARKLPRPWTTEMADTIDASLDAIYRAVKEAATVKGTLTSEELQTIVDESVSDTQPDETLNQYFTRFIEESKAGTRNSTKGKAFSDRSVSNYARALTLLNEFNPRIAFVDFTPDLFASFVDFLQGAGMGFNSINATGALLKGIINSAVADEKCLNPIISPRRYKVATTKVETVALTSEELRALEQVDLSSFTPFVAIARDLLLMGIYTLQRYSDFTRLTLDSIQTLEGGSKAFRIVQQKTGAAVVVPAKGAAIAILERYDGVLPKMSKGSINRHVKTAAQAAGINEITPYTVNGERFQAPKYKLIVSHTGRRTGATLLYLAGVPSLQIMKLTGHSTESSFLKYIRATADETAAAMAKHEFFI